MVIPWPEYILAKYIYFTTQIPVRAHLLVLARFPIENILKAWPLPSPPPKPQGLVPSCIYYKK